MVQFLDRSTLNPIALEVGRRFVDAGLEIALVGGSVRDLFLGRTSGDWDFATNAHPEQIIPLIAGWAESWWDIGRRFGTIGLHKEAQTLEITTYRQESYENNSRKPEVAFGKTLEGDLCRRDFTMNAMAVKLPSLELIDPHGGIQDLSRRLLRTPGKAEDSFSDDPLRMMRAARFSAQLGVDPDEAILRALKAMRSRLSVVSAERIRDEVVKTLCSAQARKGINLLVETGVADLVLPEIAALRLEMDEHHRHKDVYEHSLQVLDQVMLLETESSGDVPRPDFILRFAALMHDIGKPATRRFGPSGTVNFRHHDVVGAKMVEQRMKALRFDNETTKAVARLVELHMRFYGYGEAGWTDAAVRRYVNDAGPLLARLHRLTRSDVTTRNRKKAERLAFAYDDLEQRIADLAQQEELNAIRPDLDGKRIMEILDLPPGPIIGQAYRFLLSARMENGPMDETTAREQLLKWWEKHGRAVSSQKNHKV